MKATIDGLLAALTSPDEASVKSLRGALEQVIFVIRQIDEVAGDEYDDAPPAQDGAAVRAEIGERYPFLGLYSTVDTSEAPGEVLLTTADAVEDLAELVVALRSARWRMENTSEADARWHLRFDFDCHLAGHTYSLMKHLHDLEQAAGRKASPPPSPLAALLEELERLTVLQGMVTQVRTSDAAVRVLAADRAATSDAHHSQTANKAAAIVQLLRDIIESEAGGSDNGVH